MTTPTPERRPDPPPAGDGPCRGTYGATPAENIALHGFRMAPRLPGTYRHHAGRARSLHVSRGSRHGHSPGGTGANPRRSRTASSCPHDPQTLMSRSTTIRDRLPASSGKARRGPAQRGHASVCSASMPSDLGFRILTGGRSETSEPGHTPDTAREAGHAGASPPVQRDLGPVWSCDQGCDPRCRVQRRPAHNSSPAW